MIIVAIVIAVIFPALMLLSGDVFLLEIAPFITIMVLIFAAMLFVFVSNMDKSIKENRLKSDKSNEKKNQLEKLNKDKDSLFSVIAHDLRGPVGSAQQMMRYLLDNDTTEEDNEFLLEAVNASIGNSFTLLNNLLLWARNERGVIEYEPKDIDIISSVNSTILLLQRNFEEKDISIFNKLESNLKSYSDKNLFETIVRNLISNAIKFTNPNGEIIISNIINADSITISVKDNGIGITPEVKDKIFSDFAITPAHGTKNEKGSGLGLKLCKEFVEKNGGKIWVVSEEGRGSEFLFSVPKVKMDTE